MREICLDTETTGLDPRDGHRIIEIACVEMEDGVRSTREPLHIYINPRRDVPEEAFKIHGISTEFLQDKPIFDHVAQQFMDYIKDAKLVIHNAAFDIKFLNYELGILGYEPLLLTDVVDTLLIARKKFPGGQNSLDGLCKRFGIDNTHRIKHGALTDTELLCEVYIELMGGAQGGFGFDKKAAEKNESKQNTQIDLRKELEKKKTIPSRNFKVSDEDLAKHKEFIEANFKENGWY